MACPASLPMSEFPFHDTTLLWSEVVIGSASSKR